MRKEATNYERPELARMDFYHQGDFKELVIFNSDRKIKINSDYTVSANNTASAKTIAPVGSHMKVFGYELELKSRIASCGSTVLANVLKMVFEKAGFDDDFYKIESDSTVNGECISQTFTKAWMRNNYKCIKAMYSMFEELGITTNDPDCGMHLNVDLENFGSDYETQIENVRKLGYLINKHFDFFKVAVHRLNPRPGETNWAPRMNHTKDYWKNTSVDGFPTSHSSCCVNMAHIRQHRVEIRLVGGQVNFGGFRNTMETMFHVIETVNKLSWDDLDDLSKVFKGCNEKVFDRLNTNCRQANVIDPETLEKIRPTVKPYKGL